MEYWKDETEPITAFMKLFEACANDDELLEALKKVKQLIWFDYRQSGPNCSFYVETREGRELVYGAGQPADTPDLILISSADDAHRSWSDKLNPVMAIARGKVKVKGSVTGLLKLAPKLKKVAGIYTKVLKDLGWEDKILK